MKQSSILALTYFLLLIPVSSLWAQSLYQDAKSLARIIKSSENKTDSDDYWCRLTQSIPFIYADDFVDFMEERPVASSEAYNYIIINKGKYPDTLIFYQKSALSADSSVLFHCVIKYDFCIMEVKKEGGIRITSPYNELIASSDTMLVGSDIYFTNTGTSKTNFTVITTQTGNANIEYFHNNQYNFDKSGVYIFPTLPPDGDVMEFMNFGKPQLKIQSQYFTDSLVCEMVADSINISESSQERNIKKGFKLTSGKNFAVLFNKINLNLFSGDKELTFVGIFDPSETLFYISGETEGAKISAKIKVNPNEQLPNLSDLKLHPDSIPINGRYKEIALRKEGKCGFYNQLVLFKGKKLLRSVQLPMPRQLTDIQYNPKTDNIDFRILRDIHAKDYAYLLYRKQFTLSVPDSFALKSLSYLGRPIDYCCGYNNYHSSYRALGTDGMRMNSDQVDSLILFQFIEIKKGQDTTKTEISLAVLKQKMLFDSTLYIISLDMESMTPNRGILDFTDTYFRFWYHNPNEDIEANQEVFDWYPAIDPDLKIFIRNGLANFYCAPAVVEEKFSEPVLEKDSLCVLLGTHSQLKATDLASDNLWGEISEKYRHNPFLDKYLQDHLANNVVEQLPSTSNTDIGTRIGDRLGDYFAWQKYIFDEAQLDSTKQVSYAALTETYRTAIPTASENLQAASEQFGSESKKLRRGLNTADLAAGLSDFIVERAQEELNINFLNRLKVNISNDSSEFKILFEKSAQVMADFDIRQYRTLLTFARTAFEQDLRNLGVKFPKLFDLPKYQEMQNDPNVYNIFLLYDIANKVYEDMPIDTVLLHVHSRLRERKANLEEDIRRKIAENLRENALEREQLSAIVDSFSVARQQYESANAALLKAYARNIWRPTANLVVQPSTNKNYLRERFFDQFPRPIMYSAREEVLEECEYCNPEYVFAQNNIKGDPDYEYLINHLIFNQFDDFFAKKPDSTLTISLGIDRSQKLLSPEITRKYSANIKQTEARAYALENFKTQLEVLNTHTLNDLETYLPLLKKLKAMQIKKSMLSLALHSEKARLDSMALHDISALTYLEMVLNQSTIEGAFDWDPLGFVQVELEEIRLDSMRETAEGTIVPMLGTDTFRLSLYENLEMLSVLSGKAESINQEVDLANAFLDNLALTMHKQFDRIGNLRTQKVSPAMLDTLHRYFLHSSALTQGSLLVDGTILEMNLIDVMDSLLVGHSPARAMYESPLDSADIARYDALCAAKVVRPTLVSGNPFLDYFDQVQPFQIMGQSPKPLMRELQEVRTSIAKMEQIGRDYQNIMVSLRDKYAPTLVPALSQVEQFDTLTQITLLWMHAFKSGTRVRKPIVWQDSTFLHLTKRRADGTEIRYDSLQVIQRQIASTAGLRQWMTPREFNEIMDDTLLRQAFLGLLYQRLNAVGDNMQYATSNMTLLAAKLMNTLYEVDDARESLRYKKRNSQSLGFEDYYPFIRTTVDMLNVVFATPLRSSSTALDKRFPALAEVPDISNEALSLFEHVFAGNYANAIRNVVRLLTITWGLTPEGQARKESMHGQGHSNKENRIAHRLDGRRERQNKKIKSSILVYGSFMANMAEAKSPDQVKSAIRAVAVPPGNSSVKRSTRMNLDVNGYFGLSMFQERLLSDSIPSNFRRKLGAALTVPVGVSFSMGQFGRKERGSFTLFFPILDLGAVTSYRLGEEGSQADLPKLSFSNLITPGAYLFWNISKSPFTVGLGGQLGPQLRKITIDGTKIESSAYRIGATLAIDVPIFNFYTRQDKKGK